MSTDNNISLRPLKNKDALFMLEWLKDSDISKNFQFDAESMSPESVSNFISKSQDMSSNAHFAIIDCFDEYLGTISLKNINYDVKSAEYAITLRRCTQGKGYGYAATLKMLEYAFYVLKLQRIYLNVLAENINAINLYKKLGFVFEGEFANHVHIRDEVRTILWFRMTRTEFEASKRRYSISDVKTLELSEFGNNRGHLVVVEGGAYRLILNAFFIYTRHYPMLPEVNMQISGLHLCWLV